MRNNIANKVAAISLAVVIATAIAGKTYLKYSSKEKCIEKVTQSYKTKQIVAELMCEAPCRARKIPEIIANYGDQHSLNKMYNNALEQCRMEKEE